MTEASAAIPTGSLIHAKGEASAFRSPPIQAIGSPQVGRSIDTFFSHAAVWFIVFAIAWLAHFSQSRNMGFYSDDLNFAVPPLNWQMHDVYRWIHTQIHSYPEPQGRPLGFLMGLIIPYLGNQLDGLQGMFIIGWLILSANTLLFYYLLRRCLRPPLPFLGALFYLLFPADTTRPFLCHAHVLQPSLTFMLIAGHLYLTGARGSIFQPVFRAMSYIAIAACLVTYETALLPFLAMPLLLRSRDRRWRIGFAVHVGIVLTIVALVFVTRMHGGEYRAVDASASKLKTIGEIIGGSIIGPAAIAKACVYRAFQATRDLFYRPMELVGFLAALGVFALMLALSFRRSRATESDRRDDFSADVARAFQFGAVATLVSYLFCFTHFPPGCIEGQETSVHLAATIGACTLLAAGAGKLMLLQVKHPRMSRHWVAISLGLIALYFSLIFGAALDEQDSYVLLWRQKQHFWTRLLDLCPDLREGTMVLCDGQLNQPIVDHHAIWFMPPNCWSDSLFLRYCYAMPKTWKVVPQVSAFPAEATKQGWRTWVRRDSVGRVVWKGPPDLVGPPYGRHTGDELEEGNTILLHVSPEGTISRVAGAVEIEGKAFQLNGPAPRGRASLPTLPLYTILTGMPATQ
jgi:hypothetical protein